MLDGLRSLLLSTNRLLGESLARSETLEAEAARARSRLREVEPAFERHVFERDVCARQLLLLQRQMHEREAISDGGLHAVLRTSEARVEELTRQLAQARSHASVLERRVEELSYDAERARADLSVETYTRESADGEGEGEGGGGGRGGGGRRERGGSSGTSAGDALQRVHEGEEAGERAAEEEERVKAFLESRVLRGVLSATELPAQIERLLLEVTTQKLAQERLAERLDASERRAASARTQAGTLRETLRSAEREILALRAQLSATGTAQAVALGTATKAEVEAAEAKAHEARRAQQHAELRAAEAAHAFEEAKALREGCTRGARACKPASSSG